MRARVAAAVAAVVSACVFAGAVHTGAFPDGPGGPMIAVINTSTSLSDAEIIAALPTMQLYLDQVCQAWHCAGRLYFAGDAPTNPRDWVIEVNEMSDVLFAVGYHEIHGNVPYAYVSAGDAEVNNIPWTVVFTHELAEMLIDPNVGLSAEQNPSVFYALEICDPVQERYYHLGSYLVADYVYRSWFTKGAKGPYDSARSLGSPFQLDRGGWIGVNSKGHWNVRRGPPLIHSRWPVEAR